MHPTTPASHSTRPRAFTLLELLVVLALIVVLLGLLFPALSIARRSARSAETKTLINSITSGIQSFKADNQRSPGYFSARAMGSTHNGGITGTTSQGFTQMENAMLELAGGLITEEEFDDSPNNESQQTIQFQLSIGYQSGGEPRETAYIRPGQMGTADSGSYVALSGNVLRPFEIGGTFNNASNYYPLPNFAVGGTSSAERTAMRYVMDPFDRPLIMWSADPLARYNPTENVPGVDANDDTFAQDFSPLNAQTGRRSLFYWGSNSGLLRMSVIGARRQEFNANSLLGRDIPNVNEGDRAQTLEALLGNTALRSRNEVAVAGLGGARIIPLDPLGSDIIMSAGPDGTFVQNPGNIRGVRFYFDPSSGDALGAWTTRDQIDDIIQPSP
ncbi:MAG: prepilin-type N-terminal cleavage/methylation domain-containing protein [Phycisphaerales bacterium]